MAKRVAEIKPRFYIVSKDVKKSIKGTKVRGLFYMSVLVMFILVQVENFILT